MTTAVHCPSEGCGYATAIHVDRRASAGDHAQPAAVDLGVDCPDCGTTLETDARLCPVCRESYDYTQVGAVCPGCGPETVGPLDRAFATTPVETGDHGAPVLVDDTPFTRRRWDEQKLLEVAMAVLDTEADGEGREVAP